MDQALKGRLLVATPALIDPNFFRTVVLVVEHTEDGAAGLVLNRPSEMDLGSSPLESWREFAADPPLIFVGGPVSPTDALCLARLTSAPPAADAWQPVVDGLGMLDLGLEATAVKTSVDRLRVFAGYAGWGAGQLENEIEEGSWFVLDADPEDALSSEPGALWRFALKRQGGQLALVASFPADPNMN